MLLGDGVSVDGTTVEYCAEGACERVSGGAEADPAEVRDFAFLYFVFVSKSPGRHVTFHSRNHALRLIAAHGDRKGLDGVPSALRSLARRGRFTDIVPSDTAGLRLSSVFMTPSGRHWLHSYSLLLTDLYIAEGLR